VLKKEKRKKKERISILVEGCPQKKIFRKRHFDWPITMFFETLCIPQ
jgi:hypothetical protein